jgi:hypothetical protein
MANEARILAGRRLMCDIIPTFHHSHDAPGRPIMQNKPNFRKRDLTVTAVNVKG